MVSNRIANGKFFWMDLKQSEGKDQTKVIFSYKEMQIVTQKVSEILNSGAPVLF